MRKALSFSPPPLGREVRLRDATALKQSANRASRMIPLYTGQQRTLLCVCSTKLGSDEPNGKLLRLTNQRIDSRWVWEVLAQQTQTIWVSRFEGFAINKGVTKKCIPPGIISV